MNKKQLTKNVNEKWLGTMGIQGRNNVLKICHIVSAIFCRRGFLPAVINIWNKFAPVVRSCEGRSHMQLSPLSSCDADNEDFDIYKERMYFTTKIAFGCKHSASSECSVWASVYKCWVFWSFVNIRHIYMVTAWCNFNCN